MPLNIKDPDTPLAKRLAGLTGESLAKAVKLAVQERLARVEKTQRIIRLADELDHIALHCADLPRHDRRGTDLSWPCAASWRHRTRTTNRRQSCWRGVSKHSTRGIGENWLS